MTSDGVSQLLVDEAVARALKEDLDEIGDITTAATVSAGETARAVIAARKPGVIAGVQCALAAFRMLDPAIKATVEKGDGAPVSPGDTVIALNGPAQGILTAERVALNFLCHLSGVATATAAFIDAVQGTKAKISCTRKTTPGLRVLEKYAVRCGGGVNHRFGLYDAVLIKDNHIAAAGGVAKAIQACRAASGHLVTVEVEIDGLDQLDAALNAGADIIMLDNMSLEDMKQAAERVAGRVRLEASGNVTLKTVRAIAETGVDVISSGWITHSAPILDLGLDFL